jgi:tripartite-type tricarboxylate transporter receptor subunit TctC
MRMTRRTAMTGLSAAMIANPGLSWAQGFPTKPVKVVVPFPPGGSTDSVGRLLADEWARRWNQTVVVENRPGAGGNLGSEQVARAEPDGHTILITTVGLSINPHIYKSLNYDPIGDFTPISLVTKMPNLMVVPNSSPARNVAEFIAHAKAKAGGLSFASSGTGTSVHLSAELFKRMAGIEMTHVPYRGSSLALNDLLAGRVDVMFDNISAILPQVQGGTLRGLAVTTLERAPAAKDIPTVHESGVKGFDVSAWFGPLVPSKTPAGIVARLEAETRAVLALPTIRQRIEDLGGTVSASSAAEFEALIRSETETWGRVIKEAGIKIEG